MGDKEGEWVLYDRRSRHRRLAAWIIAAISGLTALALVAWHAA